MAEQRPFGGLAGFVRQEVALTEDERGFDPDGFITQPWYRALTDIYQHTGLAGAQFPMWNDVVIPSLSMRVPAANAPGLDTFQGGVLMPAFDAATDEELHFCVQFPHEYVGGTQWYPFVHWAASDAGAGTVKWVVEYTVAEVGGTFGTTASAALDSVAPGVAFEHAFTEGDAVTVAALRFSSVLAGRIYRDADDAGDTYGSDAFLLSAGLHAMHGVPGTRRRTP